VPPLAFSEVMRDVDLFVSVANDPAWTDNGLFGRYRERWERFAFGDLFPSAVTRKAVLERIVPRLEIADRCSRPLGRVFLPFDADTTLSIIISKVLLLAADRSITDPVIVSQIRGR
jgi:hypothetical protein